MGLNKCRGAVLRWTIFRIFAQWCFVQSVVLNRVTFVKPRAVSKNLKTNKISKTMKFFNNLFHRKPRKIDILISSNNDLIEQVKVQNNNIIELSQHVTIISNQNEQLLNLIHEVKKYLFQLNDQVNIIIKDITTLYNQNEIQKEKHDLIQKEINLLSKQISEQNSKLVQNFEKVTTQNDLIIKHFIKQNKDGSTFKDTIVTDFMLTNSSTSIKFQAVSDDSFLKELPAVYLNKTEKENISGTLSYLISGGVNTGLTTLATNGLFKATVNPATLMKLSSGGLSSAVMEGGRITQQAGFVQAGSSLFTPMVVFQIASFITGQYYMNNISKQLNAVQEKLDELLSLHHIERQAKLVKAFKFITENLNKKSFVAEDFVHLKLIISELTDIREEYFLMLKDCLTDIEKNNQYSSVNSLKEAKFIANEFRKTGFFFKLRTSLIADELFHLAKITDFHMNISYINPDANRIAIISDKLTELSSFTLNNLAFKKTENLYKEVKESVLDSLFNSHNHSLYHSGNIKDLIFELKGEFEDFEKFKKEELTKIEKTYNDITKVFNDKENTIIIDNRGKEPKLYLK